MISEYYICAESSEKFWGAVFWTGIFGEANSLNLPCPNLKFDFPNQKLCTHAVQSVIIPRKL